jgi:DNA-binding MarR family transcriptional regulator
LSNPKRKSQERFELLNKITDVIGPTLPSSTHFAVLVVCYRHAIRGGHFRVSAKRIAKSCRLSSRHVGRIIDELERLGVIEAIRDHKGPIPKQYKITQRTAANDDTHVTIKNTVPPGGMVTPMSVNGDTHVR